MKCNLLSDELPLIHRLWPLNFMGYKQHSKPNWTIITCNFNQLITGKR